MRIVTLVRRLLSICHQPPRIKTLCLILGCSTQQRYPLSMYVIMLLFGISPCFCLLYFQGMDSGFAEDDAYNVYDKPWRKDQDMSKSLYRPSKNDKDIYGDDLEKLMGTNRSVSQSSRILKLYSYYTNIEVFMTIVYF